MIENFKRIHKSNREILITKQIDIKNLNQVHQVNINNKSLFCIDNVSIKVYNNRLAGGQHKCIVSTKFITCDAIRIR